MPRPVSRIYSRHKPTYPNLLFEDGVRRLLSTAKTLEGASIGWVPDDIRDEMSIVVHDKRIKSVFLSKRPNINLATKEQDIFNQLGQRLAILCFEQFTFDELSESHTYLPRVHRTKLGRSFQL